MYKKGAASFYLSLPFALSRCLSLSTPFSTLGLEPIPHSGLEQLAFSSTLPATDTEGTSLSVPVMQSNRLLHAQSIARIISSPRFRFQEQSSLELCQVPEPKNSHHCVQEYVFSYHPQGTNQSPTICPFSRNRVIIEHTLIAFAFFTMRIQASLIPTTYRIRP